MSDEVKKISLGLQGGGAFGAFGWGVLDRLLAEERLQIAAISGTSAGGVNAAVVADGYARGGGREGARKALRRFWRGPSCCAFTRSASRRQSAGWNNTSRTSAGCRPWTRFPSTKPSGSLEPMREPGLPRRHLVTAGLLKLQPAGSFGLFIHLKERT